MAVTVTKLSARGGGGGGGGVERPVQLGCCTEHWLDGGDCAPDEALSDALHLFGTWEHELMLATDAWAFETDSQAGSEA